MATTLHDQIAQLAATFAAEVLKAVRGASLDDILAESAVSVAPVGKRELGTPRRASAAAGTGCQEGAWQEGRTAATPIDRRDREGGHQDCGPAEEEPEGASF
jgi:hypothetical protein